MPRLVPPDHIEAAEFEGIDPYDTVRILSGHWMGRTGEVQLVTDLWVSVRLSTGYLYPADPANLEVIARPDPATITIFEVATKRRLTGARRRAKVEA